VIGGRNFSVTISVDAASLLSDLITDLLASKRHTLTRHGIAVARAAGKEIERFKMDEHTAAGGRLYAGDVQEAQGKTAGVAHLWTDEEVAELERQGVIRVERPSSVRDPEPIGFAALAVLEEEATRRYAEAAHAILDAAHSNLQIASASVMGVAGEGSGIGIRLKGDDGFYFVRVVEYRREDGASLAHWQIAVFADDAHRIAGRRPLFTERGPATSAAADEIAKWTIDTIMSHADIQF
jgi:hypothetical protein